MNHSHLLTNSASDCCRDELELLVSFLQVSLLWVFFSGGFFSLGFFSSGFFGGAGGGWGEGVFGMQLGEVDWLRCSPDYAYEWTIIYTKNTKISK
ncbi:hypothetical protein Tco_0881345 [Tanacetum coccineum]